MQEHKEELPIWHAPCYVRCLTNSRIDSVYDGLEHTLLTLHGQTIAQIFPPVRAEQGTCSHHVLAG